MNYNRFHSCSLFAHVIIWVSSEYWWQTVNNKKKSQKFPQKYKICDTFLPLILQYVLRVTITCHHYFSRNIQILSERISNLSNCIHANTLETSVKKACMTQISRFRELLQPISYLLHTKSLSYYLEPVVQTQSKLTGKVKHTGAAIINEKESGLKP